MKTNLLPSRISRELQVIDPRLISKTAVKGHELVDLKSLGFITGIAGAAGNGYQTEGDVLTQTADGRSLVDLWNEFTAVTTLHNAARQKIIDLLTFPVTQAIEDVPQTSTTNFEEASEFGEPKAVGVSLGYFSLGYDFRWYDVATRYTWKALASMSANQVEANHQSVLDADNRNIYNKVLNALFRNTNRTADISGQNYTVYSLYNGDSTVPPPYGGTTFTAPHNHYVATGAVGVDSGDVDNLQTLVEEHGYSTANGSQLVLFINKAQAPAIRTWRFNVANANGAVALWDFIPSVNSPGLIVPNTTGLIGSQVSSTWNGMTVIGSYGNVIIVQDDFMPAGYMLMLASGGLQDARNPVGIREHANTALRGLRLLPGRDKDYPLIDAYYSRGFGTGIRQRGAAAVAQITAGSYTIPPAFV